MTDEDIALYTKLILLNPSETVIRNAMRFAFFKGWQSHLNGEDLPDFKPGEAA